jgi:hypothetical protein
VNSTCHGLARIVGASTRAPVEQAPDTRPTSPPRSSRTRIENLYSGPQASHSADPGPWIIRAKPP